VIVLTVNETEDDRKWYKEAVMDDGLSDPTVKTLDKDVEMWFHVDRVVDKQYKR